MKAKVKYKVRFIIGFFVNTNIGVVNNLINICDTSAIALCIDTGVVRAMIKHVSSSSEDVKSDEKKGLKKFLSH